MFVAHASRTMANAKFNITKPDSDVVVSVRNPREEASYAAALRRQQIEAEKRRAEEEHLDLILRNTMAKYKVIEVNAIGDQSIHRIMRRICKAYGVSKVDILSNRRTRHVVLARHALFYWARRLTTRSLPEIGRVLGGRDHTTVLHGTRKHPLNRKRLHGRTLRPIA